jgi:hypothetical protein
MLRIIISTMALGCAAAVLAGCSADSHASLPKFMRVASPEVPKLDPQPDVKRLVRDKLDSVFMTASQPRHVQVSPPRRQPAGPGWTVCVKAEVNSAMGQPLGARTYVADIDNGVIMDRRRAGDEDNCASETYEPL